MELLATLSWPAACSGGVIRQARCTRGAAGRGRTVRAGVMRLSGCPTCRSYADRRRVDRRGWRLPSRPSGLRSPFPLRGMVSRTASRTEAPGRPAGCPRFWLQQRWPTGRLPAAWSCPVRAGAGPHDWALPSDRARSMFGRPPRIVPLKTAPILATVLWGVSMILYVRVSEVRLRVPIDSLPLRLLAVAGRPCGMAIAADGGRANASHQMLAGQMHRFKGRRGAGRRQRAVGAWVPAS